MADRKTRYQGRDPELFSEIAQRVQHLLTTAKQCAKLRTAELSDFEGCVHRRVVQKYLYGGLVPRIDVLAALLQRCGFELVLSMRKIEQEPNE